MRVFDVSKWNTITNYKSLAEKANGVIIRCGYRSYGSGTLQTDSAFTKHLEGFREAGCPIGIYFFPTSITDAEAKQEADYVYDIIKKHNLTLSFPIMIDSEYSNKDHNGRSDNLSVSKRTEMIRVFADRMASYGYKCGVYASDSWFTSRLDMSKLQDLYVWNARYSTSKPNYQKNICGWQYSSSFAVTEVQAGRIDVSEWYIPIVANGYLTNITETPKEEPKDTTSGIITTGMEVALHNTKLFTSSTSEKACGVRTGTYYVWSDKVINGRIRITNTKVNVGKSGMITGWVNVSDLSGKVATEAPTAPEPPKESSVISVITLKSGSKISLKNTPLYASSAKTAKPVSSKTGTYYIWSSDVINGRIRVTVKASYVGKSGKISGWVNISDINATTSSSNVVTPTILIRTGAMLKLNNIRLYTSSISPLSAKQITGTYYIWSDKAINGRIRITNSKANVGKSSAITGWVKVADVKK